MQCDKRNSYRHRVKQEKAAAVGPVDASVVSNGDAMDEDRPQKKQKGPDGDAILLSDDGPDDDELIDAQLHAEEAADDSDDPEEDIDEDEVVDDVDEDEDVVEDTLERGPIRDEALDEPDSD